MLGAPRRKSLKQNLINKNEEQFIFYNGEKKFQQQVEIQAILNWNESYKVLVIFDKNSTMEYLCVKIAEQFEQFQTFSNLEGLKACNLTKKSNNGDITIRETGEIKDCLIDGDIIYCDLTTNEYWLKTIIKLNSMFSSMTITLDVKCKLGILFKKMKLVLMKCGMNCWSDYLKEQKDELHYIFSNVVFRISNSKNSIEFNLSDDSISSLTVKDLFSFESEIQCTVHFGTLEELMYNELKAIEITSSSSFSKNKLRWNEFKDTSFETFLAEKTFTPERQFIKRSVRKMLKHPTEQVTQAFYLYQKHSNPESRCISEEDEMISDHEELQQALVILPQSEKSSRRNEAAVDVLKTAKDKDNDIPPDKEQQGRDDSCEKDSENGNVIISEIKEENPKDEIEENGTTNIKTIQTKRTASFLEQSRTGRNLDDDAEMRYNENLVEAKIKKKLSYTKKDYQQFKNCRKRMSQKNVLVHGVLDKYTTEDSVALQGDQSILNVNNDPVMRKERLSKKLAHFRDISQYSNLCEDFASHFNKDLFIGSISDGYYTIKLTKCILERLKMPEFRSLMIIPQGAVVEKRNKSSNTDELEDEPMRVNNQRVLCFIGLLTVCFIAGIVLIFLF